MRPYVPSLRVTIAGRTKKKNEVQKEKTMANEARQSLRVAKSFLIHHLLMADNQEGSLVIGGEGSLPSCA